MHALDISCFIICLQCILSTANGKVQCNSRCGRLTFCGLGWLSPSHLLTASSLQMRPTAGQQSKATSWRFKSYLPNYVQIVKLLWTLKLKVWNIRWLQTSWTLWSIFVQCPPALDQTETCTHSRFPQCVARKNSLHAIVLLALRAAGCVEDGQPEWLPTARDGSCILSVSVRGKGSTLLASQATEKTKKRNRPARHLTFLYCWVPID